MEGLSATDQNCNKMLVKLTGSASLPGPQDSQLFIFIFLLILLFFFFFDWIMVGWHHRLNRHESRQAPGVGDG